MAVYMSNAKDGKGKKIPTAYMIGLEDGYWVQAGKGQLQIYYETTL